MHTKIITHTNTAIFSDGNDSYYFPKGRFVVKNRQLRNTTHQSTAIVECVADPEVESLVEQPKTKKVKETKDGE